MPLQIRSDSFLEIYASSTILLQPGFLQAAVEAGFLFSIEVLWTIGFMDGGVVWGWEGLASFVK